MRALVFSTLACLGCTLWVGSALAAYKDEGRESLEGLTDFRVEVTVDEKLVEAGADSRSIQSRVELRLRQAGVVVLGDTANYYQPRLWIAIDGVSSTDGVSFGGSIQASVWQAVFLARKGMLQPGGKFDMSKFSLVTAETWSSTMSILVSRARVRELSREIVDQLLDNFLNDYLAANPKPVNTE